MAYVGIMALLILPSDAFSAGADDPVLIAGLLAWWAGFPLVAGLWVRTFWWVPIAWLGPLLLSPVEPNLGGNQCHRLLRHAGVRHRDRGRYHRAVAVRLRPGAKGGILTGRAQAMARCLRTPLIIRT